MNYSGSLVALALTAVLMSGCYFAKQGEKFDARAPRSSQAAVILTNLATVESTNQIRPDWLQPPTNAFRLGPGDKIEIEIVGDNASRTVTQIGPDGRLYYFLLPGLDVWGLTLDETKILLETELKRYLTAPIVSIQLRSIDSTRIWILGRVTNPGIYPVPAPMTLLEAVSLAGGTMTSSTSGTTEDLADLSNSFVVRSGERLPVNFARLLREGDMSQNIYLQPDDLILFPSSASRDIHVLGAVRLPKAVARQHNNLVGAIADAGGPAKDAYLSHVAIVRGSLDAPKIAVVDYNDIIRGKASNILLEPRDIVYVPFSPYRFLTKYLDLILTTFVRTVAINEGIHAVDPTAPPATVTVGVGTTTGTVITPGTTPVP